MIAATAMMLVNTVLRLKLNRLKLFGWLSTSRLWNLPALEILIRSWPGVPSKSYDGRKASTIV